MTSHNYLSKNMSNLTSQQLALFAALVCERLYSNYLFFSLEEKWGDIDVLDESLMVVYYYIKNDAINIKEINKLIRNIENISPDLDEFSDSASYALDCCSAFEELLTFIIDKNTDHIKNVSVIATDSVDMFIQELENFIVDEKTENEIINHKSMLAEQIYQKIIVKKLLKVKNITNSDIEEFRKLNKDFQSINLKLLYQ